MTFPSNQFYYPTPQMASNDDLSSSQGLGDFLGCLRRRKKIVGLFTALALFCALVFILGTPRQYEAHAALLVQLGENKIDRDNGYTVAQASQESIVLSTVEMLRSPDIAEAVISDMKLNITSKNFLDHLNIKPVGRSLLIDAGYRNGDAKQSAAVVNRLVDLYQKKQQDEQLSEAEKSTRWLTKQLNALSQQVKKSAQAVEEYRTQKGLFGDGQNDITQQQINDISSQLIAAKADAVMTQATHSQLKQITSTKNPADGIESVSNAHMVAILKNNETDLLAQQAQLQSKYGPNHPRMKAIQTELAEIRAKKNQEMQRAGENIGNNAVMAQAKVDALQQSLNELEQKHQDENNASIALHELERQAQSDRTVYEDFLTRYKDLSLTGGLSQPGIKLISAARVPMTTTSAPWFIIMSLFTLFGFIVGILTALMLEQLENHIRTPEQLRMLAPSMDVLAMIPQTTDDLAQNESFIESVRSLRVALMNEYDARANIIAVTSALAGEGKSTTSLWLARVMAASGVKVLLVDGDFRHAGLQQVIALNPFYSVADILLKRAQIKDIMTKDSQAPNLSLLVGKTASPSDIDLLTREKVKSFVASVQSQYDIVIIDTPPSVLASEAIWWLQEASKALYLVRWDHTPYDVVRNEIKRLKSYAVNVEGFVITRVDAHEHAAYGYHDTLHHYMRHQASKIKKVA